LKSKDAEALRYPLSKIFAPGKVDQSSAKSFKICYEPIPLIVLNFIELSQRMYEKSVTIFTLFSILAPQGNSIVKSSTISALIYSKARANSMPNFVPF